ARTWCFLRRLQGATRSRCGSSATLRFRSGQAPAQQSSRLEKALCPEGVRAGMAASAALPRLSTDHRYAFGAGALHLQAMAALARRAEFFNPLLVIAYILKPHPKA